MTDKQDTHDRTRRRPPESFRGAHTEDKGRGGERANGKAARAHTRQPRNTQQAAGAEDKRREGREGGERGAPGLAPGLAPGEQREGRRERRSTAAGREQGESRQTEKSM